MYSKLYTATIQTSEAITRNVLITCVRTTNSTLGNPRYGLQVWIMQTGAQGGNHLWEPTVTGYRFNKTNHYIMESFDPDSDIQRFITAFTKAVRA
jgi:hypothetical protein